MNNIVSDETRDAYMDFLKGLAIIAMIVGHSILGVERVSTLFNVIYSFHMPLLIFISAYIEEQNRGKYVGERQVPYSAEHHYEKTGQMLMKRARGLLLPYFSWMLLDLIVSGGVWEIEAKDFVFKLLGYGENGLWFFPVLFGLKILHFCYWYMQKNTGKQSLLKDILLCALLGLITAVIAFFTRQPYLINMCSYAIPYFFAVIIVDHTVLREVINSEWVAAGSMLVYIMLFTHFSFYDAQWTTQIIRIGLSLCVIVICCKFQKTWELNCHKNILCIFGRYSLAIYVLHEFFLDYTIYFSRIESSVMIAVLAVLSAIIVSGICVAVARVIEISSWWKKVLFGK